MGSLSDPREEHDPQVQGIIESAAARHRSTEDDFGSDTMLDVIQPADLPWTIDGDNENMTRKPEKV